MNEETMYGLAGMGFVILILALAVVIVVALIRVWQTKVKTTKEDVYQKLASNAIESQKETARMNDKMSNEMTEIKERLTSIERILKEVE